MRRRRFLTLVGGAAAWPLAAHSQQLPTVAYLHSGSPEPFVQETSAFHDGLRDAGYLDGQNVVLEDHELQVRNFFALLVPVIAWNFTATVPEVAIVVS
jgi:hypothetical protein